MQEEKLTFEEIQLLREREANGQYVPAEVVEAYFAMKEFLYKENHETANV
jgi:hypothetical protein